MSGSNVFKQRHARRTTALGKALDIVSANEFLLDQESALTLRKHILARFVESETNDLAQQSLDPLDPESINSTLFGHTSGRRK